jgi:RNA 3'-terminal phosphate cyclase (ATP)
MLTIDGFQGEGGGQILRTALSLSLATGQPFRIVNIRAGRQHLASVMAAAAIGRAEVEGAVKGSQVLAFQPHAVVPGDYSFTVGTAGSATLVLQTVLPALMTAAGPSALVLEGGTHNPLAPPFEFLSKAYLPLLHRMGPNIRAKLDRHGFYPAGGGKMRVTVAPVARLARLDLPERGALLRCRAVAVVSNLPRHVAERELKVLRRELRLEQSYLRVEVAKSHGPGNVLLVEVESLHLVEVMVGFGELGVRAEVVAGRLAKEVRRYLEADVPVGEHLADQLLLPLALAGGGSLVTFPLSSHSTTNIEIIQSFLPIEVRCEPVSETSVRVVVSQAPPASLGGNDR